MHTFALERVLKISDNADLRLELVCHVVVHLLRLADARVGVGVNSGNTRNESKAVAIRKHSHTRACKHATHLSICASYSWICFCFWWEAL